MVVKFPAYRDFDASRIAANDAMMALLIGARLGEHDLRTSAATPETRLPTLFGQIASIDRVNRTVGDAARLLSSAERQLAEMAIPFVLAVHAAYVTRGISMLRDDGLDDARAAWTHRHRADVNEIPLGIIHEYFEERAGMTFKGDLLQLFHLCRRVRNRIIHSAGRAGSRLPADYRNLPKTVRDSWERLTGRPVTINADGRLNLAEGELIAVLAISRHVADDVNHILAETLPNSSWARIAVQDYADLEPQRFAARDQRLRRVRGYVRTRYAAIALSDADLLQAIADRGSA